MTYEAILFDCDGVLVDSEPITNGVLCEMLNEAGWLLAPEECMRLFIGKTVRSETARIEARTGRPLTDAWMAEFYARRNARLQAELVAIANAPEAVRAVHARLGGRIACASGADRQKVEMQLAQVGLAPLFAGRVFSGHEMPATKPAPDVYLAAAAAVGVPPARCLVVEDTVTGVMAGVAAGATVVGYSTGDAGHGSPGALRAAGAARIIADMAELPALLG
ncbi:HAD family phosphatase [Alicycliphilus denitrificans]|uniref:HAD-superfamily hydrolase, subfamily IA, variant 3 n=2 Tax=Alicycliphilus denitrificans TaxID=179636 RepID=F4G5Z5_ALIDK|nr:HAD family phosphatase [Alicycliphilus denitrificans]ADV01523.1 HAD-superfamily hydrolase, subfamily IA, variant 3 [Alicycliphilus denitrificans BC]AEB86476.1 HAD-superfamily hydrolase, subfamily IA, variant 3 [Alicycliphilus denitrificans K601]QKD45582.1 HAD family phosphatase [Alicycliphilus denitrificans]GAO25084.1 HAD family hydrolase [Alicycliphilus sp. B1]